MTKKSRALTRPGFGTIKPCLINLIMHDSKPFPRPTQADWQARAERLGLKRVGSELVGPCPSCGGTDRFHVRRDGLFGCRGCSGFAEIMRAAGFETRGDRRERRIDYGRGGPPEDTGKTSSLAARLILASGPCRDDTPGWAYIVHHRLAWPPDAPLPQVVGWIPAGRLSGLSVPPDAAGLLTFAYYPGPCLSVEAIRADGERTDPRDRRTYGQKTGACIIRHGGNPLVVEGEVSALAAARMWPDRGAVCAGGAGRMVEVARRLSGRCTLIADGDPAGVLAAYETVKQTGARLVQMPRGYDAADILHEYIGERAAIREHDGGQSAAAALAGAWADLE